MPSELAFERDSAYWENLKGVVTAYDGDYYLIKYEDGDQGDMSEDEFDDSDVEVLEGGGSMGAKKRRRPSKPSKKKRRRVGVGDEKEETEESISSYGNNDAATAATTPQQEEPEKEKRDDAATRILKEGLPRDDGSYVRIEASMIQETSRNQPIQPTANIMTCSDADMGAGMPIAALAAMAAQNCAHRSVNAGRVITVEAGGRPGTSTTVLEHISDAADGGAGLGEAFWKGPPERRQLEQASALANVRVLQPDVMEGDSSGKVQAVSKPVDSRGKPTKEDDTPPAVPLPPRPTKKKRRDSINKGLRLLRELAAHNAAPVPLEERVYDDDEVQEEDERQEESKKQLKRKTRGKNSDNSSTNAKSKNSTKSKNESETKSNDGSKTKPSCESKTQSKNIKALGEESNVGEEQQHESKPNNTINKNKELHTESNDIEEGEPDSSTRNKGKNKSNHDRQPKSNDNKRKMRLLREIAAHNADPTTRDLSDDEDKESKLPARSKDRDNSQNKHLRELTSHNSVPIVGKQRQELKKKSLPAASISPATSGSKREETTRSVTPDEKIAPATKKKKSPAATNEPIEDKKVSKDKSSAPKPKHPVGTLFFKRFGSKHHGGIISSYAGKYYRVRYPLDGDEEDLSDNDFEGSDVDFLPGHTERKPTKRIGVPETITFTTGRFGEFPDDDSEINDLLVDRPCGDYLADDGTNSLGSDISEDS